MASPTPAGQARTSCQRCYRRKKRCDRTLPQCETCQSARAVCSFLEDNQQVGSYPVKYVRGLEERVKSLEADISVLSLQSFASPRGPSQQQSDNVTLDPLAPNMDQSQGDYDIPDFSAMGLIFGQQDNSAGQGVQLPMASLGEELRLLSLEAAAERHLGPSSGLSFARLTQTILQRLSPDKAEFIFPGDSEMSSPHHRSSSRSDVGTPDFTNFIDLQNVISNAPTQMGKLPLGQITEPDAALVELGLPVESHARRLVDFYFAHTHTLYPFINRAEFNNDLMHVYENSQYPVVQLPLSMFRVWMVLAIGSTTLSSISLLEESESILYYSKAMLYFESALSYGDMAALEVLMLQVSYSFFNQLGPNTWFLVGVAARMAVGIGLHASSSYEGLTPVDVERRKRIFFSIYMMDRVVSLALGRPFALHDDDIDITPFSDIDDEENTHDSLLPSPLAIPLHILGLRRIASKIARLVYANGRAAQISPQDRTEVVRTIHKELIEWRRNMPFPLPDSNHQVPHLSSTWSDFNFYTHLAMLYRPSPLFPTLDLPRVKTLADAAAMSIRQARDLHRQGRFAYNWLNLLTLFTVTLSLIYAITAQPNNLVQVLEETRVVGDLEIAIELFELLSKKFLAARRIQRMVEEIVRRYRDLSGLS